MPIKQRRIVYATILLLGLAWIFLSADKSHASIAGTVAAPQQNFLAPDFMLKTTTGKTIKLSDYRGQAVLVNLWATWCPPCRAEMKSIEKVYNEYKDKDRKLALDILIESLSYIAKNNGYEIVYTSLKNESLINRYKNNGFLEGSKNATEMIKIL